MSSAAPDPFEEQAASMSEGEVDMLRERLFKNSSACASVNGRG